MEYFTNSISAAKRIISLKIWLVIQTLNQYIERKFVIWKSVRYLLTNATKIGMYEGQKLKFLGSVYLEFAELLLGARGLIDLENIEANGLGKGPALANSHNITNGSISEI